jgi:hypothetical protein
MIEDGGICIRRSSERLYEKLPANQRSSLTAPGFGIHVAGEPRATIRRSTERPVAPKHIRSVSSISILKEAWFNAGSR